MEDAPKRAQTQPKTKNKVRPLWSRFVHHSIRQHRKHKAEKQPEPTADKAARRTAFATIAIAFLTLVLAVVSFYQWKEIHGGSTDTHDLAVAAGKQADRVKDQSDRTKDLADRMKDQADRTKDLVDQATIQAKESRIAADAAKSAALTADKALHISERAYIVAGQPTFDTGTKYISLPIINSGHIPSGKIRAIIHEVTLDGTDPTAVHPGAIPSREAHWKHYEMESVPTTFNQSRSFTVFVPALNVDYLNGGREQIIIVGVITYSDGFPDDAEQQWPFCYGNAMLSQSKTMTWALCDSNFYLPQAIQTDHYPNNEYDQ